MAMHNNRQAKENSVMMKNTPKRKAGAKTKLTPEVKDKIVTAIRIGSYDYVAAKMAGISRSTFYEWQDRGSKEKKGIYSEFLDALKKAEAEAEIAAVNDIRKAGETNWQARAWWLERRHGDRWSRRDALALSGKLAYEGEVKHEIIQEAVDSNPEVQRAFARATAAYYRAIRGGQSQPAVNPDKTSSGKPQ
jgi:transposase